MKKAGQWRSVATYVSLQHTESKTLGLHYCCSSFDLVTSEWPAEPKTHRLATKLQEQKIIPLCAGSKNSCCQFHEVFQTVTYYHKQWFLVWVEQKKEIETRLCIRKIGRLEKNPNPLHSPGISKCFKKKKEVNMVLQSLSLPFSLFRRI